jgi:hypothetical protein
MAKTVLEDFPTDILVDATKSKEAVFVHPDQSIYADGTIAESFRHYEALYNADKESRIRFMASSVFHFRTHGTLDFPSRVNVAAISTADDAESDEALVVTSPLNDGRPKSSADAMVRYIHTEEPSFWQIAATRPNSWDALTKLEVGYHINRLSGRPMPTIQIFSRVPPHALTLSERGRLAKGDYSGYGRVAYEALNYVNDLRRLDGQKPIRRVHGFGAGIGQRVLGAMNWLATNQDTYEVASAHAMNLALRRGASGTALDHTLQREVNEPSGIVIPAGHVRIDEPQIRKDIDHRGSDTLQMFGRQAWAIKDLAATTLPFMLAYKPTVRDVESLLSKGIPVRLTNGLNVGMAINTLNLLPITDPGLHYSTIVGIEGQKVGMMSNEHVGVVGVVMPLGVRDHDAKKASF